MSANDDDDNSDHLDLPTAEDAASTGAAADSADWDERLKGLPRLLRYAMLIVDGADHVEESGSSLKSKSSARSCPIISHGLKAGR
ncbi:hypothetical protein [Bradyrhizobium diazoefficiens]